ncbi:Zn-dependent [Chlorella sorokiniana]|uniref:Zn-dependent n=1 Tax=Chlorella sorokiniana TaxID=3076 RepID=A0A2P6THM7_CHLSO|nr:Zn-dependent [Chlorella sorokiniana]|eukprot:PRW33795.1 Zn-dependent [Chlorella sorokiniana]
MRGPLSAAVALAVAVAWAVYLVPRGGQRDIEDAALPLLPSPLDAATAAEAPRRIATALTFATLADADAPNHVSNPEPFEQMHAHLERSFPLVYQQLKHEKVNQHSLLFSWEGSDSQLRPILTMAHIDVVPAPTDGPGQNWTHPPFSGAIADGFIWGRGTLDIKSLVLQQLEAVELLLRQGYQPKRTIYLAFGHDEEVGGAQGAKAIAALLQKRGVELELVLDEGGSIMMDGLTTRKDLPFPVMDTPMAVVGTSEKGYETWEIAVRGTGGHSGMPPVDGTTVAARMARILAALEAQPATTRLAPPTTDWLLALAPAVQVAPLRLLLQSANNRLLNPILGQLLGQLGREVNPFVRTTCAVVKIQAGGVADNVLPGSGAITVNCRTLPGQEPGFVGEYLAALTRREGAHVSLCQLGTALSAPPVAAASGPQWNLLKQTILETLRPEQGLVVAPYMLSGMTDSRHYLPVSGGRVYRFQPQRFTRPSLATIHGVDERIAVDDYLRGIGFYVRFYQRASADQGSEEAAAEGAAAAAAEAAAAEAAAAAVQQQEAAAGGTEA